MKRPQYGIDAPGLVRFFFISGAASAALFLLAMLSSMAGALMTIIASLITGLAAIYLLGMGCFMIWFSRVEKPKEREKLLDLVQWSGDERVLDVGCGRGLMLVGAARRLRTGTAIGIDLWRQQDQTNNSAAAALENAKREGVAERVGVQTADMRKLPFADHHFDVITSNWTVHNLEAEADRRIALDEMIRVLKPGGAVVLADIANQAEYARHFASRGMAEVRRHNQAGRDLVLKAITFGSFAPSAVTARKSASAMPAYSSLAFDQEVQT